jgi:hypothetical protein
MYFRPRSLEKKKLKNTQETLEYVNKKKENISPQGGGISADVIWRKKYEKWKRNRVKIKRKKEERRKREKWK